MIKKFSTLYVGNIDMENLGMNGTQVNDRSYPNERLVARIPHLAQTSDAVNRQLSCFSSRYMNLLAVFQI